MCKEGNHWELQGITSYGLGFECGQPKSPGIYVRVTRYLDWIAAEMNGESSIGCTAVLTK